MAETSERETLRSYLAAQSAKLSALEIHYKDHAQQIRKTLDVLESRVR